MIDQTKTEEAFSLKCCKINDKTSILMPIWGYSEVVAMRLRRFRTWSEATYIFDIAESMNLSMQAEDIYLLKNSNRSFFLTPL